MAKINGTLNVTGLTTLETLTVNGASVFGSSVIVPVPVTDFEAVTKKYVDDNLTGQSALKVNKSGDTMSGFLTLHANPTLDFHAATKQYVDMVVGGIFYVTGPSSAINNNIALFDGTTGKIIKDGLTSLGDLNTATQTVNATNKATLVDADKLPVADSEASNVLKYFTYSNLKSSLSTYFNTLYSNKNYSVGFGFTTTPTASEILLLHTFSETITFPDEFLGSVGRIRTNPTASFVLTVQKNVAGSGITTVGTITVSTAGVFTFTTTGTTVVFAPTDELAVIAPVTPDTTAANVSINLLGTR